MERVHEAAIPHGPHQHHSFGQWGWCGPPREGYFLASAEKGSGVTRPKEPPHPTALKNPPSTGPSGPLKPVSGEIFHPRTLPRPKPTSSHRGTAVPGGDSLWTWSALVPASLWRSWFLCFRSWSLQTIPVVVKVSICATQPLGIGDASRLYF